MKDTVARNILLNPGPATTTDSVKYAQVVPDICPRESEFGEIMQEIASNLTCMVANEEEYTTVLFGGSGTAAVESIISSVVEGCILVVNNGAYGDRIARIARTYRLSYVEFVSSPVVPVDLSELESAIVHSRERVTHLAVVHNETTTGLLTDIGGIGQLCAKHGIVLIVDAMSSFAAIPIDMEQMNIQFLAASSNKNLQGMAGVSFVIADKRALENSSNIEPRSFYLHLYSQYRYFLETKQLRFTPPVQTLYALKQAIAETLEEGIAQRYQRYSESWLALMDGLAQLKLEHLVDKEHHSRIITAILEPELPGYNFEDMHDYLHSKGITIYPGKLGNQGTFRIANIGDIAKEDILLFLNYLKQYLESLEEN